MVCCGMGFYLIFDSLIEKSRKPETIFFIEVMAENMTAEEMKTAQADTLAVYESRLSDMGLAGTSVKARGTRKIEIRIPGHLSDAEAGRVKQILSDQDRIFHRLALYGPIIR